MKLFNAIIGILAIFLLGMLVGAILMKKEMAGKPHKLIMLVGSHNNKPDTFKLEVDTFKYLQP